MRLEIEKFECIGGMRPLDGGSPFDSASVIVRDREDPERIARVTSYLDQKEAIGEPLTADEWRALCVGGHAHELDQPVSLRAGARIWLLSRSFDGRSAALADLRNAAVLMNELAHDPDSDTHVVLVREVEANRLRDGWAERAHGQAREHATLGCWPRALALAEQAWVLGRGALPKHWALLALCYERVGRQKRASGMFQVARRSHGEQMARDMTTWRDRFAEELPAERGAASPGLARPKPEWRQETRREAQLHNQQSLEGISLKPAA